MIANSLFTQIGMVVLAVGIAFFYVQPTFSKIGKIQEAVAQYQDERTKVTAVNDTLYDTVSRVNTITATDMKALTTYMPDSVDHISVERDIFTITNASGAYLESIDYAGIVAGVSSSDSNQDFISPVRHSFSVNVSGSYEQVKLFFSLLEQNNYPMEVHELKMSSSDTGLISSDITIITYSHI